MTASSEQLSDCVRDKSLKAELSSSASWSEKLQSPSFLYRKPRLRQCSSATSSGGYILTRFRLEMRKVYSPESIEIPVKYIRIKVLSKPV